MRHYVLRSGFLTMGAALLFVTPFEIPPRSLSAPSWQAAKLSEIRWEFDTGG
jgi:hypothetical protein